MEPKQTAQELVNQYRIKLIQITDPVPMKAPFNYTFVSKQCALIDIENTILALLGESLKVGCVNKRSLLPFYEEVKQEIEKL